MRREKGWGRREWNLYWKISFEFIRDLKVLSSEMDPAEMGSLYRLSLKREALSIFWKICLSPILWELFNVTVQLHLIQLVAIRHLIASCPVRRIRLRLHLWFYIVQGLANERWKNLVSFANCRMTFFIVIFHFSLVKAAMNAPHLCKLCKDTCQLQRGWVSEAEIGKIKLVNFRMKSAQWKRLNWLPNWQLKNKEAL